MENDPQVLSNKIEILIKNDGTYLSIHHPAEAPRISRMDVLSLIESYGVSEVDFITLNEVLKNDINDMEVKISNNTSIIQVNESAAIEIAKDRMEAYITFSAPINNGNLLSTDDVLQLIEKAGVVNTDYARVDAIVRNKRYERKYVIAEGKAPKNGVDGYLKYHFDNSNLRPTPKIMDDGTVNFRQLGLIRLCNRGDILVTSVPPTDGEDGVDVCGRPITFPKGRLPMPIPKGKNTVLSEDGLHLIADVSGQLVIQDAKINISPCLEIKGNVDNSTGDIDFNGSVTIRGNVVSGFTVKAIGDIEVLGVCEGANLISDANIVLGSGAQGTGKAQLTAAKDITAKFIESCTVNAGGNIVADSIIKSTVRCNGNVTLTGKNGLLVGGSLVAGNKLTAKTIGSPMGTATEIEVGSNPMELIKHKEMVAELEKTKIDFEKCELAVNTLNALQKKDQLSDEKKNLLLKMISAKMALRGRMAKLQTGIDELAKLLTSNSGTVSAHNCIRPGVRVTIGSAQLTVHDDIQHCQLKNNGEKITIGSCT